MCRTGGPRCTRHAREAYGAAMSALITAGTNYANDPGLGGRHAAQQAVWRAQDRVRETQAVYDTTTGGLTDLARELRTDPDNPALLRRWKAGYGTRLRQLQVHDMVAGKPERETLDLTIDGETWHRNGSRNPPVSEPAEGWRYNGAREHTGNPFKPWADVPEDYRYIREDGTRTVLANIDGIGSCSVPWQGPPEPAPTQPPAAGGGAASREGAHSTDPADISKFEPHGGRSAQFNRNAVVHAFLTDPGSVQETFGSGRSEAARQLHGILRSITPTSEQRVHAAFGAGHEQRVKAYDQGRRRFLEMYSDYVDLSADLPDSDPN